MLINARTGMINGIGRLTSARCNIIDIGAGFGRSTAASIRGPSFGPLSGTISGSGGGAAVWKLVEREEAPLPSRNEGGATDAESDTESIGS